MLCKTMRKMWKNPFDLENKKNGKNEASTRVSFSFHKAPTKNQRKMITLIEKTLKNQNHMKKVKII